MHYKTSYRENLLRSLLCSLGKGFDVIDKNLHTKEWYDGLFAKEEAEGILGIAFIAAQAYITGVVADFNEANINYKKDSKFKLLSSYSELVKENVTSVQLIDTVANYYKHNDEWSNWEVNNRNKHTIEILIACGITINTEFPCYEAATILWPENEIKELSNLLNILVAWREQVF
jgi:hypothetical protein